MPKSGKYHVDILSVNYMRNEGEGTRMYFSLMNPLVKKHAGASMISTSQTISADSKDIVLGYIKRTLEKIGKNPDAYDILFI